MIDEKTPPGFVNRENPSGTPKLSNSSRIDQTASLDDQHVSTPWGSTTMEIALELQKGE